MVLTGSDSEPSSVVAEEIVLTASVDGRLARAQRTRTTIVDALLSLLNESETPVTAGRIAERAQISPRLIYHHFGDLESLFQAVAERQGEQIADLWRPIDLGLSLDDRIDALLDQRIAILELLTPVRRAVLLHEPFSIAIQEAQHRLRTAGRAEIEVTFGAELNALAPPERVVLANALEGVLAWGFWNDLGAADIAPAEARATVRCVLVALLRPACDCPPVRPRPGPAGAVAAPSGSAPRPPAARG